jgi:ribosomal protein S27E
MGCVGPLDCVHFSARTNDSGQRPGNVDSWTKVEGQISLNANIRLDYNRDPLQRPASAAGDAVMRVSSFFVQECPTCGRTVQVRVEHLGRTVVCQHCSGRMLATDDASKAATSTDSSFALMRRAEELLQIADAHRRHAM